MTPGSSSACADVFVACREAMLQDVLIQRVSRSDKEFHFQNWVGARLDDARLQYESKGRNSYPDFTLVHYPEGYEIKGLKAPGRMASYDSNSRVPAGMHHDRTIYYVFGRYPAAIDQEEYPVLDLVICHGDFLSADHAYLHENKSFPGFGSYGDLLVRDRKMYVAPTPFALATGTTGQATLITSSGLARDERLELVGELVRTEAEQMVVSYTFDLRANKLTVELAPNPSAGKQHMFSAYRLKGDGSGAVSMVDQTPAAVPLAFGDDE